MGVNFSPVALLAALIETAIHSKTPLFVNPCSRDMLHVQSRGSDLGGADGVLLIGFARGHVESAVLHLRQGL